MNLWQLLKDILLTGTGLAVIVSQVFAPRPSDLLLTAGLVLPTIAAGSHAAALLSDTGRHSSPPGRPSPSSSSSSPPTGVPGEPG